MCVGAGCGQLVTKDGVCSFLLFTHCLKLCEVPTRISDHQVWSPATPFFLHLPLSPRDMFQRSCTYGRQRHSTDGPAEQKFLAICYPMVQRTIHQLRGGQDIELPACLVKIEFVTSSCRPEVQSFRFIQRTSFQKECFFS